MKKAFEKWASTALSDSESEKTLLQARDGVYSWSHVQDAWFVWQAAWIAKK